MINQSKIDNEGNWKKWRESGAVGTASGYIPKRPSTTYPRDMSIDRQGNRVVPSREDYERRMDAKTGKAYAFFNCDVSLGGLEKTLPYARRDAQTPGELELALYEGNSQLKLDEELRELLEYPDDYRVVPSAQKRAGMEPEAKPLSSLKYTLAARFPGETNERTAEELRDIMGLILPGNDTQEVLRCGMVYRAEDSVYSLI